MGNDGSQLVSSALAYSPLFAALDGRERSRLESIGTKVEAAAGSALFRQGDDGDCMYVVVSGLLEALYEDPPPARVVRTLRRGDVIGELAIVCDMTRSATVRAVRDCELWRVGRPEVEALLRGNPDFAVALTRLLGERVRSAPPPQVSSRPPIPSVIAVIAVPPVEPETFTRYLAREMGRDRKVACLGRYADSSAWPRRVDAAEQAGSAVLLSAIASDGDGGDWARFCAREADRVAVLAAISAEPRRAAPALPAGCDLVLGGRGHNDRIHAWTTSLAPRAHHIVDASWADGAAMARAARRVSGRAVGVVLSGGGARGLAHIGVLAALADAGLVIDRVGGTSMGAFVASLAARDLSPSEVLAACRSELVEQKPFNDYTAPKVALLRGKKARAMLKRLHGDVHIGELPKGFFCVSADIVTAEAVTHRRGRVVDAVAASMSLPGLAPPMVMDGRILVDGGVVQNLPVRAMQDEGQGPVVAVDVSATRARATGGPPSIVETLTRATMLGSRRAAAQDRMQADAVIRPLVEDVGLMDFSRIDTLVAAGRRATEAAIEAARPGSVLNPRALP